MMNAETAAMLCEVRKGCQYAESEWRTIVNDLLDDLEFVLGDFERDRNPMITPIAPSFSQWIWHKPGTSTPVGCCWSGVMYGGICAIDDDRESFVVSFTLFLFSSFENRRLVTADGHSIFTGWLELNPPDSAVWRIHGWCTDEWDEWTDVKFSDETR
jgi:hypothetical protein